MILTCPECATSYFVDDARIPPGGRTVKCTNCGARWHTADQPSPAPSEDSELFDDVPEAAPTIPPEPEPSATPEPEPAPVDDLIVTGPTTRAALRRPAPAAKKTPGSPKAAFAAVAAIVALVVLAGAAVLLRDQVTAAVPEAGAAYAAVGLPADTLGLVIEDVKAEPAFQGGRPVITLTGLVRNLRAAGTDSPSIRIEMLGAKGAPLAARVVRPLEPHVPGKAGRHFALTIPDPPKGVRELALTFEAPAGAKAPPAVRAKTPPAAEPAHDAPHG